MTLDTDSDLTWLYCVCAQNSWDRSRPLIVHAASSTSYPISHYSIYKENVYPYWSANPAKFRFNFGGYQRCAPPLQLTIDLNYAPDAC